MTHTRLLLPARFLSRPLLIGLAMLPTAGAPIIGRSTSGLRPSALHSVATGRIEGTVELSSALAVRRPSFRPYSDPGSGSLPPDAPPPDSVSELRNVVIYIQSDAAGTLASADSGAAAAERFTMSQTGERFVPHVVPVVRGATVDFPNNDDFFHNVFSLSSAKPFDLGRYPKGSSRSVTFTKAGTVQLFCHIHSDMSGIVLVLDNRYFATPEASGHFAIDGVPPGDYTVVGWHERIKPVSRQVRVASGQATTLDFNIPLPAPGASKP